MKSMNLICLILTISLSMQSFATTNLSPVRGFITELAMESAPKVMTQIKSGINNPKKIAWKSSDPELTEKVLTELKKQKATIAYDKKYFTVKVADITLKITLVDLISRTYSINGQHYIFSEDKPLRSHIDSITKLLKNKVVYQNPFIEEAHAFLPLVLLIPGILAASAAVITIDGFSSGLANDLKNMDPKTQDRINKLKSKYNERANICESDLENAKSSNTKGHIEKLTSVRAIGQLHKVLNTELYDKWFNGKSQINYDKLGCGKLARKNELASGSFTGIFSGTGKILGKLCLEQDRLNNCFSSTEEVMRDQGIQINELSGPDQTGPFKDLDEEYKELSNTISK